MKEIKVLTYIFYSISRNSEKSSYCRNVNMCILVDYSDCMKVIVLT